MFRAQAFWGLDRVTGTMSVLDGHVEVDADGRPRDVTAAVSAASVLTGRKRRDVDLRGDHFLDAQTWPRIELRADSVRSDGEGWTVDGVLSVRGTDVPVTLVVAVDPETGTGDGRRIRAAGAVDLGPTPVGVGGIVSPHVRLEITATLCPPRTGTPGA
jgi:polyisoprenoid-binding protein YceI